MRESRKILAGFTLAELILAMAIVAILTIAMVPMLKYHRVRQRENFTPHGIIECYYVRNGSSYTLHQFIKDNEEKSAGEDTVVDGSSCVFDIPKANYYELHVITSGDDGQGYTNWKDMLENTIGSFQSTAETEKTIMVDESFSSEVASLPDIVQEIWKNSSTTIKVLFSLQAPRGTGGYDSPLVDDNGKTKNVTYGTGNSGNSMQIPDIVIRPDTQINIARFPSVYTGGEQVILRIDGVDIATASSTQATGGKSFDNGYGICDGSLIQNTAKPDNCGNKIVVKVGQSTSEQKQNNSSETIPALVMGYNEAKTDGEGLIFKYKTTDFKYYYGGYGTSGERSRTYYGRIGAKHMKVTPAKDFGDDSKVEIYNKAENTRTLFKKKTTNQSNELKSIQISNATIKDFPVPEKFLRELKVDIKPPEENIYYKDYCVLEGKDDYDKGMCHYILKQLNAGNYDNINMPGTPGYGGYPILNQYSSKEYINSNKLTTLQIKDYTGWHTLTIDNYEPETHDECLYSEQTAVTPKDSGKNKYCSGTKGSTGAIILLW